MSEATYYRVDTRMWDDEDFVNANDLERSVWMLLLTGPQRSALPGLQRGGMATLAETLRRPVEAVEKAFGYWVGKGKATFDEGRRVIWVPNAPKYNEAESPNQLRAWWNRWREIPECDAKYKHVEWLRTCARLDSEHNAKTWQQTFGTVSRGLSKPSDSPSETTSEPPIARARADSDSDSDRNIDRGRDSKGSAQGSGLVTELSRAYADGIADGSGEPWRMPDANVESRVIGDMVMLHKPNLRGEQLLAWVKRSAATYRRAMGPKGEYQKGFRPSKWAEWLNAGQPSAGASSGPGVTRAVQPGDVSGFEAAEVIK